MGEWVDAACVDTYRGYLVAEGDASTQLAIDEYRKNSDFPVFEAKLREVGKKGEQRVIEHCRAYNLALATAAGSTKPGIAAAEADLRLTDLPDELLSLYKDQASRLSRTVDAGQTRIRLLFALGAVAFEKPLLAKSATALLPAEFGDAESDSHIATFLKSGSSDLSSSSGPVQQQFSSMLSSLEQVVEAAAKCERAGDWSGARSVIETSRFGDLPHASLYSAFSLVRSGDFRLAWERLGTIESADSNLRPLATYLRHVIFTLYADACDSILSDIVKLSASEITPSEIPCTFPRAVSDLQREASDAASWNRLAILQGMSQTPEGSQLGLFVVGMDWLSTAIGGKTTYTNRGIWVEPRGRFVIGMSSFGSAAVWRVSDGKPVAVLAPPSRQTNEISLSPGGTRIAYIWVEDHSDLLKFKFDAQHHYVHILDLVTGQLLLKKKLTKTVLSINWQDEDTLLLSRGRSGTVTYMNVDGTEFDVVAKPEVKYAVALSGGRTCVLGEDFVSIVEGAEAEVWSVDIRGGRAIAVDERNGEVFVVAKREVIKLDLATGKTLATVYKLDQDLSEASVDVSNYSGLVAVAGVSRAERFVQVFRAGEMESLYKRIGAGSAVRFDVTGTKLFVGDRWTPSGSGAAIRIIDLVSGN
jgi:hypothetical protein